jgi:XTP/dITP diphosphohydrolase
MHGGKKTDAANNALLLKNMLTLEERGAHFYCALVAVRSASDPEPLIAEGRLHGHLLKLPQGTGGFGYDPLLYLPEQACSVAQLSPEQKNSISHRAQAAQHLLKLMRALWL